MKNNENNNFDLTVKVSTVTKIMVLGGLLGIFICKAIPQNFLDNHILLLYAISIIEVISTTFFSAGLISVIVEISTIKNLVTRAFRSILSGAIELDGLNQNALLRLKNDIALKLLDLTNKDLSNSPYRYEENLLNSVNEKYYEHHNITYHITPDELNECFHVKTKIDYGIVNKNLINNVFEFRLKLYKLPNSTNNASGIVGNNFSASLMINGKPIDANSFLFTEPITHHGESTYYDCKIKLFKELTGAKNKIKAEINYDVPLFDICQSFKISAPCKNIEHKFYINKDIHTGQEWIIQANAYSTFYHKQDEENSNYMVEQNVDDSLIIRYTNWALVGNGYCVFYQKKH